MSETNSTVPQGHSDQARAGSRRAMREAERAAERQAALTGTQPVLTRRELRRLREEAAALQAAIEAGEITLEQAKALQDPLAEAPNIDVPALSASGAHAAGGRLQGGEGAAAGTAPVAEVAGGTASGTVPSQAAVKAPAEAGTGTGSQADQTTDAGAPASVGQAAASAVVPAHAPVDAAERARREELAKERTGLLEPVDIPDAFEPGDQGRQETEQPRPARAPQRRSLRARLGGGEQTAAPAQPRTRAGSRHAHQAEAAPGAAQGADDTASQAAGTAAAAGAAGAGVAALPAAGAQTQRAGSVTRRPIVRIPAAAQGVRTVDAHTGELSAVRPADESLQPIETPKWKALRAESVTSDAPGQDAAPSGAAAEAGTAQPGTWTGPAMSAATPEASEGSEPEDAVAADAARDEAQEQQGRGLSHYLLWALFVLVVVLVVATLVWFYLGRESADGALGAASAWLAQTTNGDLL